MFSYIICHIWNDFRCWIYGVEVELDVHSIEIIFKLYRMMSMNTAKDFCNYTFSTYRWPRVCSKNNCHCDWTSSWKCPHRIISDFSFVRKDMYQIIRSNSILFWLRKHYLKLCIPSIVFTLSIFLNLRRARKERGLRSEDCHTLATVEIYLAFYNKTNTILELKITVFIKQIVITVMYPQI